MGYPERISIEGCIIQVIKFELIARINHRNRPVGFLHQLQPRQHVALKVLERLVTPLLHIKDGRQVTLLKVDLLQVVFSLCACAAS